MHTWIKIAIFATSFTLLVHARAASFMGCAGPSDQLDAFGWEQMHNACPTTVNIFFKKKVDLGTGMLTLASGQNGSIGYSRSEIASGGGLQYAVCGKGESAYETDGRTQWKAVGPNFVCK